MKAVLWTDTFQTTMMITGLLATLIQGCIEMGGFTNAWKIAKENERVYFDEYVKLLTRNHITLILHAEYANSRTFVNNYPHFVTVWYQFLEVFIKYLTPKTVA